MTFPTVELRRLCTIANGGTPTPDAANWDGDIPWATPIDLGRVNGKSLTATERTLTRAGAASGSTVVPAGSVILSTRAPIGYTAVAGLATAFNQGCKALLPFHHVDSRFLRYAVESSSQGIVALGRGSTFLELNSSDLAAHRIPAPQESAQRKIADYLDHETAEIDAFIADLAAMKDVLIERRSATVAHAFKGRGGQAQLKRYGELQSGLTLGASYVEQTEQFPYLRVANVQAGLVTLDEVAEVRLPPALASRYMLRAGDVLLTEGGDRDKLGRGALWVGDLDPMLHQNHIFAFRCNPQLLPDYLVYALEAPEARRYFDVTARQSTNLASTNASIVLSFPLPVPSVSEQLSTIEHLNSVVSQIADEAADIDAAIALAKERRAALITAAVTGQIEVSTKHPPVVDSIQTAIDESR